MQAIEPIISPLRPARRSGGVKAIRQRGGVAVADQEEVERGVAHAQSAGAPLGEAVGLRLSTPRQCR